MPPVSRNEKEKNHVHCTRHSFSHVLCKVCNQQLRLCNEGHFIHVDGNLCEQNINFNYLYIFECIHVHLQFEYSITFNNNFYLSMPLVLLEDIYEHSRASVSREEARFFFWRIVCVVHSQNIFNLYIAPQQLTAFNSGDMRYRKNRINKTVCMLTDWSTIASVRDIAARATHHKRQTMCTCAHREQIWLCVHNIDCYQSNNFIYIRIS